MVNQLNSLNGDRLTVLRDLKGLTQADLATKLDVSQGFISHVEQGTRPLPVSLAIQASETFRVPLSFFSADPGVAGIGPFTFRKKSRASVRDERRVTALYTEAARLFFSLSLTSGFRTRDLPKPQDYGDDPELCAQALRASAGLAKDEPVVNVTRLLERHGIGVISRLYDGLENEVSDHVGISRPTVLNDRPLVAITHQLPGAVQRLSLGHEAGHWIFDGQRDTPVAKIRSVEEARAFRFGGALLLPAETVQKRVTEDLALHGYLRLKAEYGISVGAIVRRSKDLGVISPARYRSLNIQISSQGWRRQEPVEVAHEEPRLIGQALKKVHGDRPLARASSHHGIEPSLITLWIGETKSEDIPSNVSRLRRREAGPAEIGDS